MKRVFATLVGLTCCAGSAFAADRLSATEAHSPTTWSLNEVSPTKAFLSTASAGPSVQALPAASGPAASSPAQDLARLALKISYVGSILLTADRVIRSVDSVLDGMQVSRPDGTRLKLLMEPGSRGVDVMVKMSRPFDF